MRTGEAQGLKVLTPLAEDQGSVPSIHIRWPTAAYNSSFNGFDTFLTPRGTWKHMVHIDSQRRTHTHI